MLMDNETQISLRRVTADNYMDVIGLSRTMRAGQYRMVASNAFSLAEAYADHSAWPRAIYAGNRAVGFLMLQDKPDLGQYYLWRLMIGGDDQGKGYGRRAMELLIEHVRTRPRATELLTSYVPGEGGPKGFYRSLGFVSNGKVYDEELGLTLPLAPLEKDEPADQPSRATAAMPDYARINRDNWNAMAHEWVAAGRRNWQGDANWGIWGIPNDQLPLLPADMRGMDAIELGCGTGYVSGWMHRRGARVSAIDPSKGQLCTARELAAEHGAEINWIEGIAEAVPQPDASFDFAISEYGAAIWADPRVWIPEAHRLLRAGGELVFLGNSCLSQVCTPLVADGCTEAVLHRPWFGMHRTDWHNIEADGGIEFHLSMGDWFRLFDDVGFDVFDFREVQAPATATGDRFAVTAEWAQRYPSEQTWRLRKRR